MTVPTITRDRTWVWFTSSDGLEWEVFDAERRRDGRLWRAYPSVPAAERRYFVRRGEHCGTQERPVVEVRRYRFRAGESHWFDAVQWDHQLAGAIAVRNEPSPSSS